MNTIISFMFGTTLYLTSLLLSWGIPISALKLMAIAALSVGFLLFGVRLLTAEDRVDPKKVAGVVWRFCTWCAGWVLVLWALWASTLFPQPALYSVARSEAFAVLGLMSLYGLYRKGARPGDQSALLANLLQLHFDFCKDHQSTNRPIKDVVVFFFLGEKDHGLTVRSVKLTDLELGWTESESISESMCFYDEPLWLLLITYQGTTKHQWHISDLRDTNVWKVTDDHRALLDTDSGSVACYTREGEVSREQFAHDVLLFALLHRTWREFLLRMCLQHAMETIKESRSTAKIQKLDDLREMLGYADLTMFGAGESLKILKVWKLPPECDKLFAETESIKEK